MSPILFAPYSRNFYVSKSCRMLRPTFFLAMSGIFILSYMSTKSMNSSSSQLLAVFRDNHVTTEKFSLSAIIHESNFFFKINNPSFIIDIYIHMYLFNLKIGAILTIVILLPFRLSNATRTSSSGFHLFLKIVACELNNAK